jgi:potassium channel subfamily K
LLVALVIAAHYHLRESPPPKQQYAFSQSFYYAIISAVIYFIVATALLWNMLGAYIFKAYPPAFTSLTVSQRTLMLQTMSYVFYLALGAGIFSSLESWDFVDGVYWANYTLLTIGIGSDFPLRTTAAKALLIPYAGSGIIMVGLVVGSVRSLVLERGGAKFQRRALERERQKTMVHVSPGCSWKQEFDIMRGIQKKSDRLHRFWGLSTSFMAFLLVWLVGAMVFMFTEAHQRWTYFEALYFSYTSLLTVGYGDYYTKSNSGKPFFVIWSLVAVPTVTILISHMGDTVIEWVKDATLWLGQRTVLLERQEPPTDPPHMELDRDLNGLNVDRLDPSTRQDQEDPAMPSPNLAPTKRIYCRRIAKAIAMISKDAGCKPPKTYGLKEWELFLGLLGGREPQQAEYEWMWLGEDGALLSGQTEVEWLLSRLCELLQEVLDE